LDAEALALVQRAQPLPPLPPEMEQATIELVVPLRFQLR
jgi:protein TonB